MPVLSTLGAAIANVYGFTSGLIKDQYFNLVSLLLPGNGTNGAQNNTFLDGSSNNFTITRNGNTTQGTFSPFSQTGWGGNFNGTSFIQAPDNATMQVGTSDFTIEMWAYFTSDFTGAKWIGGKGDQATATGTAFSLYSTVFEVYSGSTIYSLTCPAWSSNRWYHIAIVRSGTGANNLKLYIDGSVQSQASIGTNSVNTASGNGFKIGAYSSAGVASYISNFRFVKGRAVYTSAFTPPTSPLGVTTGGQNPPQGTETSLLVLQSNRFNDVANNYTLTLSGSPSVTPFSPFAPTQSYSAAAVGGSGYFDGTGDYLELANNSAFDMGTGNFTAEFYVYTQDQTNSYPGILANSTYNATGAVNIRYDNTGNANKFFVYLFGASPADPAITSGTYGFNQWMHVALVRDSSTSLKLYINGVLDGSQTISSGQTVSFGSAASTFLRIGRGFDVDGANGYYAGNVSNVRIVKGQALASGNFTPPSAPVTASAVGWSGANAAGSLTGTVSLLLNFTNAGVVDATAKNVLETVGNAQISTTQSKWGGGSMYFDGNGDYIPQYGLLLPTTGDFTVEAWIRVDSLSATRTIFGCGSAGTKLAFLVGTSGLVGVQTGSAYLESAGSLIATNTWYHVALTRTSNTYKIFVDGTERTLSGVGTMLTTISNSPQVVGAYSDTFGGSPFSGYMDDFRISMFRRYTSNFTAPTAPFPVQ